MSDNMRDLKRRIKTVSNTEQVTHAMRTVAVSKYNRVHKQAQSFAPYRAECARLLSFVGDGGEAARGADAPVCYVVVTANRGLCGGYNEELLAALKRKLAAEEEPYNVIVCGRWGADNAAARGVEHIAGSLALSDVPTYEEALALYRSLRALWDGGEARRVVFAYQAFRNILTQVPTAFTLLPADTVEAAEDEDTLFVPDRESILPQLREQCLAAQVYGLLLTAAEGAHGAMLVAMRTASDNSHEMLSSLELELNRLRQAAVTTEVIEIAGGAAADRNGGQE